MFPALALAFAAALTPQAGVTYAAHVGQPAHWKHAAPAVAPADFGRAGDPSRATRTIEIRAAEMTFDRPLLRIRKGETVRLVLVNEGRIAHEITVGDAATQLSHRRMMVRGGHVGSGHAHPNAVEAAPGERRELVWQFTEAGRFEFACNLPGHAEAGMAGAILVE